MQEAFHKKVQKMQEMLKIYSQMYSCTQKMQKVYSHRQAKKVKAFLSQLVKMEQCKNYGLNPRHARKQTLRLHMCWILFGRRFLCVNRSVCCLKMNLKVGKKYS